MSRMGQQREAEWEFRQEMRDKRERRLRRAQAADARMRRWLELVAHQDEIYCECCGRPSAGPWVEPGVDVLLRPARIDWADSANLVRCMLCGGWLCAGCVIYQPGVGRRCKSTNAEYSGVGANVAFNSVTQRRTVAE